MVQNIKLWAPESGGVALHNERCKLTWGKRWKRLIHKKSNKISDLNEFDFSGKGISIFPNLSI